MFSCGGEWLGNAKRSDNEEKNSHCMEYQGFQRNTKIKEMNNNCGNKSGSGTY